TYPTWEPGIPQGMCSNTLTQFEEPGFEDMGEKVLFFSRGDGPDHARRDLAIAKRVEQEGERVEVIFASWGEGYRRIRNAGWRCENIGRNTGDDHERLVYIGKTIGGQKPDLIVTDEELLALPMAKVFDIPSILITNWFPPDKGHPLMGYFVDPDLILVPLPKDIYAKPVDLLTPVKCVGPIAFLNETTSRVRGRLKQKLKLEMGEKLILVDPFGVELEDEGFFKCCVEAFEKLNPFARMIMVVGKLKAEIESVAWKNPRIQLRDHLLQPEPYMMASDLIIHRGGFFAMWKPIEMSIPTIYVPRMREEEFRPQIIQIAKNLEKRDVMTLVKEEDLSGDTLASAMREILHNYERWEKMSRAARELTFIDGATGAALEILKKLQKGKEVNGDDRDDERGAVDRPEH
ncbi:TPA: hypothetical protein EYP37_03075, partial [Candidatus Poribacteria bacterium]|nr:hypothetical protein [Candidatus Poribacteria bacterium]